MSASRARTPRGRVLLVGDDEIVAELARRWPNATSCPGPFDALARVIAAPAREPIVAIAIETSGDSDRIRRNGRLGDSVEALDPSIEVLHWARHGTGADLPDGTTATLIRDAASLHAELVNRLGWPAEELSEAAAELPEKSIGEADPDPAPEPSPPIHEPMTATLETPVPVAERGHAAPTVETIRQARGPLGDLDLVEAVLAGGDRLGGTAIALLRERLGSSDLELLPPTPPPGDRGRSAVEVRDRETRLGWLASTSIPAAALAPWAGWMATWMRLDASHAELRRQALTDELTGVGNRRAFEQTLAKTLADARPRRRPVTLMVFDIDNFKTYNDQHGHEAGDEVLRETVQLLRSTIRRGDHVFRIGGDEFVVIFSDPDGPRAAGTTPIESVEDVVHRFQAQVTRLRLPALGPDAPGTVTVSAGLATYPWDGLEPRTLLAHADQLSLKSKREGKNRITFGPGAREHLERR
ncbi:MAG: GGDEF domain-containing protein [Phycisphaerales bacterium]|jgi:diguanylate cyclase (GGDEF)-like protein